MVNFLLILMGQNLIFSVLFISTGKLLGTHSQTNFIYSTEEYAKAGFPTTIEGLINTWDLMNGMSNYTPESNMGMVFYYMFTILETVAMLNIIIAKIGDVFERICDVKKEVELLSKAEILYEYALLNSYFKTPPTDDEL